MIELLREGQLAKSFRKRIKNGEPFNVAVAFWGKGAAKKLGVTEASRGKILCNLSSPACNPHAIKTLVELGGVEVRSHPRLHAKFYMGKAFLIVGSSNVSTNGLNEDGAAAAGWIEANLLTDDAAAIKAAEKMFSVLWKDPATTRVTKKVVDAAILNWRPIGRGRPQAPGPLFDAVRADPSAFDTVWVMAYEQDIDEPAKQAIKDQAADAAPDGDLSPKDLLEGWYYQIEQLLRRDAWLIDLDCISSRKSKVHGAAQVSGLRINVPGQKTPLTHAIRGRIKLADGRAFSITDAEKTALIAAKGQLLRKGGADGLVKLAEAVEIIDRSAHKV